jgi:hypothetical protein
MTASTGRTGGGYYRAQELASKSDGGNPGFSIAEHITNQIIKNEGQCEHCIEGLEKDSFSD